MVLPGANCAASASVKVPSPDPRSAHVVGPSASTPLPASISVASRSCIDHHRETERRKAVRRKRHDLCDHTIFDAKYVQRQSSPGRVAGAKLIRGDSRLQVCARHQAAKLTEPL